MSDKRPIFKDHKMAIWAVTEHLENAQTREKVLVDHPGGTVILPLTHDNQIVFIRNQRDSVQQTLLELPAGTLEPPEPLIDCATRELTEETGYRAEHLVPLGSFYSAPGFCTELLHAFVASELTFVGQNLAPGEYITTELVPITELPNLLCSGTICDSKTLATLALYLIPK